MKKRTLSILAGSAVLMSLIVAAFLLGPGCGSNSASVDQQQGATTNNTTAPQIEGAPANALFGQRFFSKADKRTYIYDGNQWVPHDKTVDDYYASQSTNTTPSSPNVTILSMTQDEVRSAPCTTSDGTGAHPKHAGFDCKVCHMVGGLMCFDPAGPATAGTGTAPSFDATAKTCSNVACHGVKAGTFSYYIPGNEMDEEGYPIPELKTAPYGGNMAENTPSWYATGVGCTACHSNPPTYNNNFYPWHSGNHANSQNMGAGPGPNACELCHNDTSVPYGTWSPIAFSAVGTDGKVHGTQINPAAVAQHANGTATVYARFKSICFNCH
jgi:hypothetical protein